MSDADYIFQNLIIIYYKYKYDTAKLITIQIPHECRKCTK